MTVERDVVLALDIGGTKVSASLVASDGSILWSEQAPVADASGSPSGFLEDLVSRSISELGSTPAAVGVAIPAVLDSNTDAVVWAPNLPEWSGLDIREAINRAGHCPVTIEYDGHAAALGEAWLGAGRSCDDFVVVAVGTGIGCGIVSNGEVVRGADRLAGAAGWMIIRDEGVTWESAASSEMARRLASAAADDSSSRPSQTPPHPASLFEAAADGDQRASQAIDQLGREIGIGIANLVSVLNPDRVILTGGLGARPELIESVRGTVREFAQPVAGANVEISTSPLGSSSVLLGAARSALSAIGKDDREVTKKGNIP